MGNEQRRASVISWAQNLEDVMLARAFEHSPNGFYIDVGAFDPDVDSVTKHFYDIGWRGINVEPLPGLIDKFRASRPRDINLGVAVGEKVARLRFYDFTPTGLSTLDAGSAADVRARGFACREIDVAAVTLRQLIDEHAPAVVDFLKIDVEGAEAAVLAGADFARHRPRVLVIEATAPMTSTPTHAGWEPMLLRSGYLFAWFDGLNRFYVRREDADLLRHFRVQPNVFDDYWRASDTRRAASEDRHRRRRAQWPRRILSRLRGWVRERRAPRGGGRG